MKSLNAPSFLTRLLLASSLLLLAASAQAAIFVKFDGIDGESRDDRHRDWSDVLSVSEGLVRPDSGAVGSTRTRGAARYEDIVISKELDKASVKLRESLALGRVIPKVEIEVTATYGGARTTYFKYEMKNVIITSFQMNASGNDTAGPPVESVALNFEEIKVTYTEIDDDGSVKGNVEFIYRVETGI
ncbi:MAG: type VI secretion system tube protein Hcp [Gammaproteobacteria bacterium]